MDPKFKLSFRDELFTRVRARRDSDDDDAGLPHSPCTSPTTADVLAQGLKDKPCHSRSSYSAGSLISMGSSENDEDSGGIMSSNQSSRVSLSDRRTLDFEGEQLDVSQPVPLNHNAALHKISVRPKRTHGLPRHRKLQQIAAAAVATLPVTPEVTEDLLGPKTPSTHSEEDRQVEIKPVVEEKIINIEPFPEFEENIPEQNIYDELEEPIYDEVNIEDELPVASQPSLVLPPEPRDTGETQTPSKPTLSPKPTSPTMPEPLFIPTEKPTTPEVWETLPSPVLRTPTPASPLATSPLPTTREAITPIPKVIPSLELPITENKPIEIVVVETPPLQPPAGNEVISPVTSRGATPVSLESKILSKSKSTAAELKLRHEIKQFSKRQKEMKEEMLKKTEEDRPEVIDVKECAKSKESPSYENKLGEKTKSTPTKEVIEEDLSVVSAERFFIPIDRTVNSAEPMENKLYKPVSRVAETEIELPAQHTIPVTREEKLVKNKGHFTVNDVGMSPTTNTGEEKFTSTILVSNTSDDATTKMSVISSSDLNQLVTVERPPRKNKESHEGKNRLTSGLVTVENQSFSTCSTLKLESDFKLSSDTSDKGIMSPLSSSTELIGKEILEDVIKGELSAEEYRIMNELFEDEQETRVDLRKDEELPETIGTDTLIEDGETKEPEPVIEEASTPVQTIPEPVKELTTPTKDEQEIIEQPKVVLRKHHEKNAANRNSVEATSAFSSLDFENIMKQRRSITENDILAQKVNADEPGPKNTPEASKPTSSGPNQSNSKRLSVEIVPYNTRVKESSYASSPPPKPTQSPPVVDNVVHDKEPKPKTEESPAVEIHRKLSFTKTEMTTTASNEDLTKHPVQFRIRRGKSLNEKSDSMTKESSLPEKPKLARPKSQIGSISKDKPPMVEKPGVPEFMKIQLRSSKEELDSVKNELPAIGNVTPPPTIVTPTTVSPKTGSPTPQWEVKIGQPKFQRQTSVSLPPIDLKTEVKKKDEKPLEKASSTTSLDTKSQRKDSNAENKENMGLSNVPVKEDAGIKEDNAMNGNESDESSMLKLNRSSQHSSAGSGGSIKMSDEGRRKSQGYVGGGMGTDAEPELFRVFARRSIKQRNPDKNKQQPAINKDEQPVVADEKTNNKVIKAEPAPTPPAQTPRASLSQQPAKPEIKQEKEKIPPWKQIPKPVNLDKTTKEVKVLSKENVEKTKDISPEVIATNSPQQRPRFRAKSVLVNESPIPQRERKTSAPTETPKIVDKSDSKKQSEIREINSKNSNKSNNSLPQVTVNIKPQETTTPIRKSSITTATRVMKNSQPDIIVVENSNNGSEGSPLSWKQLALQNREERVRKEMRHCPNTVVLDSNNSGRSRNSKVLDLVNNFQKLQTT